MTRMNLRLAAVAATVALLVGACGGDDDDGDTADTAATADTSATDSTAATESAPTTALADDDTESTEAAAEDGETSGWTVSTDDCVDADRANAPIEGTINIGSSAPLSGGPAAAAFAPVIAGYQAYIDYANENGLLPDHEIVLSVGDDQYDPALTPGVVNGLLDDGVNIFSGILGTPANAAVRDLLNEECVPQLMVASGAPMFGEAEDYPWTMGGALPYNKESAAYAADVAREFPDGATVGVFYVNNFIDAIDTHGDYVVWMLAELRDRGEQIVDVTTEAEEAYAEHCHQADLATAPLRDCLSYYNGDGNAKPGSLAYYGGNQWHKWRQRAAETMSPYVFGPAPRSVLQMSPDRTTSEGQNRRRGG